MVNKENKLFFAFIAEHIKPIYTYDYCTQYTYYRLRYDAFGEAADKLHRDRLKPKRDREIIEKRMKSIKEKKARANFSAATEYLYELKKNKK